MLGPTESASSIGLAWHELTGIRLKQVCCIMCGVRMRKKSFHLRYAFVCDTPVVTAHDNCNTVHSGIAGNQIRAHLIWKRHLRIVVKWPKRPYWHVEILVKKV